MSPATVCTLGVGTGVEQRDDGFSVAYQGGPLPPLSLYGPSSYPVIIGCCYAGTTGKHHNSESHVQTERTQALCVQFAFSGWVFRTARTSSSCVASSRRSVIRDHADNFSIAIGAICTQRAAMVGRPGRFSLGCSRGAHGTVLIGRGGGDVNSVLDDVTSRLAQHLADVAEAASTGCLREGAKSYVKRFDARYGALDCVCASRKGIHPTRHRIRRRAEGVATEGWRGVAVQPARTFSPCSRNWPAGPTYR